MILFSLIPLLWIVSFVNEHDDDEESESVNKIILIFRVDQRISQLLLRQ